MPDADPHVGLRCLDIQILLIKYNIVLHYRKSYIYCYIWSLSRNRAKDKRKGKQEKSGRKLQC